jgi:hypothetical protein
LGRQIVFAVIATHFETIFETGGVKRSPCRDAERKYEKKAGTLPDRSKEGLGMRQSICRTKIRQDYFARVVLLAEGFCGVLMPSLRSEKQL